MEGAYTVVNFFPVQHLTDHQSGWRNALKPLMDNCVTATALFIFKHLYYILAMPFMVNSCN